VAGNLLCSPSTLFGHIGFLFSERLDTLFTSSDKKFPDSSVHTLSDSLRIYFIPFWPRPHVIRFVADIFFSTLKSGFIFFRIRCRIRRIRVDGSRIQKEKVADSKISGYVWMGKMELVYSGYGYRPHYNAENDHRKRSHSKTLSRVVRFENDAF